MRVVESEEWVVDWAARARLAPHGRLLVGLLLELATQAPVRAHLARTVDLPLESAAGALGTSPAALQRAVCCLTSAGLISHTLHEPAGRPAHVSITLLSQPPEDCRTTTAVGSPGWPVAE
ncbi:hypothetical protein [Streptomyces sp. NPDC048277]|uniref:hypothetical protein n=1 Tax=Streptomyces sp. NPDC048277 TaxID=3155027 RepID=UPI0033D34B68